MAILNEPFCVVIMAGSDKSAPGNR